MAKRKIAVDEKTPMREVIEGLKNKALSLKDVPDYKKAMTIGHLHFEGWSHPQLADLFGSSEKTIQRSMKDFKDIMAVMEDAKFIRREIGYFVAAAENQIGALLRVARSPNSSNQEKIVAEMSAWKIRVDTLTKLQSVGLVPAQVPQVNASITHHLSDAEEQTPEQLRLTLNDIEREGKEVGVLDVEAEKRIKAIRVKIQQLEVTQEIVNLKKETQKKEDENETTDQ